MAKKAPAGKSTPRKKLSPITGVSRQIVDYVINASVFGQYPPLQAWLWCALTKYVTFQLGEVAITRNLFATILDRIARLAIPPPVLMCGMPD